MSSCDASQNRTEDCKRDECEEDRQPDSAAEAEAQEGGCGGRDDPRQGQRSLRERAQPAQRAASDRERQEQPREERAADGEDALGRAQEGVAQSLADLLAPAEPEPVTPRAQEQVAC